MSLLSEAMLRNTARDHLPAKEAPVCYIGYLCPACSRLASVASAIANFSADASPGKIWMSLALREAAARCTSRGVFFFCLTHVQRNLQYNTRADCGMCARFVMLSGGPGGVRTNVTRCKVLAFVQWHPPVHWNKLCKPTIGLERFTCVLIIAACVCMRHACMPQRSCHQPSLTLDVKEMTMMYQQGWLQQVSSSC